MQRLGLPRDGASVRNAGPYPHTEAEDDSQRGLRPTYRMPPDPCVWPQFETVPPANDTAQRSSNSVTFSRVAHGLDSAGAGGWGLTAPRTVVGPVRTHIGHVPTCTLKREGLPQPGLHGATAAAYLEARRPVNEVEVQVVQLQVAERLLAGALHHALLVERAPQLRTAREHVSAGSRQPDGPKTPPTPLAGTLETGWGSFHCAPWTRIFQRKARSSGQGDLSEGPN